MGTPQAVITIQAPDLDLIPVGAALDAVRALIDVHGADAFLSYDEADDECEIKIKVENSYEDGHESEHVALVEAPASEEDDELEEWWDNVVQPETGDGHGADNKLGYCYTVTVLDAPNNPDLVGETREWAGR